MSTALLKTETQLIIDSVLPADFFDIDVNACGRRSQSRKAKPAASPPRPVSRNKPLLSGKDFILPELVKRADNGDLSVSLSRVMDDAQRDQIFRLAECSEAELPTFATLTYAEQRLERRRYFDYLKRIPKADVQRRAREGELESWRLGEAQAETNFHSWWGRKQARRQSALQRKANRLANCGASGRRLDCSDHPDHRFFGEYRCQTRYCRRCGPDIFSDLFGKYAGLWPTAKSLLPRCGFRSRAVIAQLDFTAVNLSRMPTPTEVREFNQDIRSCVRQVLSDLGIKRNEYGYLWCDEFGGWNSERGTYNTNLHAHGVYVGPYIPREVLIECWTRIRAAKDGAWRVWIGRQKIDATPREYWESEHRRFIRALGHALKYTGKHVARSDGDRLAELEIAFHGVRRVHTMGTFYHANLRCSSKCDCCEAGCELTIGHQGEHHCKRHGQGNRCPLCTGHLMFPAESGYARIADLLKEGRRELGEARSQIARDQVFHGPRGPDAKT